MAKIIRIHNENPQERLVREVVGVLRSGGEVVIPTDTVYALGAAVSHPKAIENIRRIKKIERTKYLSFIFADFTNISEYVSNLPNKVFRVLKKIYPGPYTSILNASKLVPKVALNRQKTVGIRIPKNNITLSIVKLLGEPIVSTSVYVDGVGYLEVPEDINEHYRNDVALVVDGGIIRVDPSTVIDFTKEPPEIIRAGKGSVEGILDGWV